MSEPVIVGVFHWHPAGARVWECTVCKGHFVWGPACSQYGSIEYPNAVFCSDACAAKWAPSKETRKRIVMPAGHIDTDRVHLTPFKPKTTPTQGRPQ